MGETPSTAAAATSPTTASPAPPEARTTTSLAARVDAAREKPWVLELLALAFVCATSLLIAVIVFRLWDDPDLRVPMVQQADTPSLLSVYKNIHEHGWIWHNPSLGAPFGLTYYDYGSLGPDNLHWAMAWLLTRVASQPGTVLNALAMLSFPMAAASAYAALRWLNISRLAALAPAVLFAVVPYHFLRVLNSHLLLAESAAVPLLVFLAIAIAIGMPLWAKRASGRGNRVTQWASWTSMRTLGIAVVVGSSGIYYALFTVLFVVVAMIAGRLARNDDNFTVFNGGATLIAVGGVLVFNLLPTVLYHHAHGSNDITGQRNPSESLVYGLNLIGQVLPPPTHRIGVFETLGNKYWAGTALPSEGSTWGGTLATLGLLVLIASIVGAVAGAAGTRWIADRRLRATALIGLVAAIMGATGAGGAFVSFIINPSLRAWDRISIVIVFCSLVAIAIVLDTLGRRAQLRGRRASYAFAGLIPILIAVGAWDQTNPGMRPDYKALQAEWSNDSHFVRAISSSLGGHGSVYQLPYLPFPESPPVVNMPDYAPLKGYLHAGTGIHWSYASMKGRPEDWEEEASQMPLEQQIPAVALAGFDGLWIDTAGYASPEAQAIAPLREITGLQPIISFDSRLQYFDLRPLRAKLQQELPATTTKAVGPEVTHPLQTTFGDGFYQAEQGPKSTWRWAGSRAQATIDNPLKAPRRVVFSGQLGGLQRGHVRFTFDGRPIGTAVAPKSTVKRPGRAFEEVVTVGPGTHVLGMTTDAPATPLPGDARDLRVQVLNPVIEDAALDALDD